MDDAGNVYAAGYAASPDFPSTTDSYNSTHKGKGDVFMLKFDKDLKTILASSIIGGSEDEVAYSFSTQRRIVESVIMAAMSNIEDSDHAVFNILVMSPITVTFYHFWIPFE